MILCAISGSVIAFIVSKYLFFLLNKITIINDLFFWYGINSLAVFPIHLTIKVFSKPLLAIVGLNNWICILILMFVLTIPIVNFISNYLPFMLGSFNYKKQAG